MILNLSDIEQNNNAKILLMKDMSQLKEVNILSVQ